MPVARILQARLGTPSRFRIALSELNLSSHAGTIYLQVIYGNNDNIQKFVRFDDMVLECYW